MAEWDVVSHEPADPWKPVSTEPVAVDPWKVAKTEPVTAVEPSFLQRVHQKIDPEPIIGGVVASAGRMLQGLLELPERAIKGSQQDVANMGSGEPMESVGPAADTAMATVQLRRTVGGVRAHPSEATAEPANASAVEWKPVKTEPLPTEPATSPAGLKLVDAPEGGVYTPDQFRKGEKYFKAVDAEGNVTAEMLVKIDGTTARIEDILNPNAPREEGIGTLGNTQLRGLIKQFREQHPEITELAGKRVSGSRMGGEYSLLGEPTATSVKLPEKSAEPVKTMNADATPPKVESISEPLAHPEPTPEQMNTAQSAANAIRKIFNPENLSDAARSAAADIRQAGGRAARDTESTRAAFEEGQKLTSKLTDAEKIELNDYIETRSKGTPLANKELQPIADVQREAVQSRKAKIEALDSTAQAEFRDDYLTHIYKDPEAARVAFTGPAKEGSGRFLKERTIPTLKEAMARGLEPITLDPLEMTQRYVDSMDRFIATRQVIDGAKTQGYMKAYPRGEQPAGWVEVNTKHGSGSMPYYAPADYARIYNNFVDRGWSKSETWGPILDTVQRGSNAITSLKLGLSGFHALTMAKEAYASGIDRAVAQFASGQPIKGAISAVKSPTKFIENAIKGKQLKDIYLGRKEGTPIQNQIVDLITDAGGRMKGGKHAADYQFSAMDSYWNSIKRGSVKAEIKAAASESMKAYGLGSIKVLAQQFGRVMQTVAKPLFEHYIPALKNGAAYDMMSAWLEANPRATHAEQLKAARKVVDAIDDRFGEMIQDNIFWNKTMKQAAQTSMLSYSWALGTARAIGGGTASLVRNPARLSMKHPDWKPQANYALALPFVVATANAAYQYLKTWKAPDDIQDLMAPETGGMVAGVGTKQLVKERGQTPGYEKDVFGWLHSPKDEAFNKLSGAIQIPYALARNKDWKDQPIRDVRAPATEQVGQLFKYIYQQLTPISISKLNEGTQKGSKISKAEVLMGIKNAPAYMQDPKGSKDTADYYFGKDWDKKTNWEKSHAKKYGGPQ